MAKTFGVIIPAAGSGTRFGEDKLMYDLCGKPVLWHTLSAFQRADSVTAIVVPTRRESLCFVRELAKEFNKVVAVVEGGKNRQESVFFGLAALPQTDYVSVHDAARPLILPEEIDRIHRKAVQYGAVCLGSAVTDTLQQVDENGFVVQTPDRASLMSAATPQVFEYELYQKACKEAKGAYTDDTGMVRVAGGKVKMIPCNCENFKITAKDDAFRAQQVLLRRKETE